MKKIISFVICGFITTKALAIDPAGSRVDYGESSLSLPAPLLLLGLLVTTIGCFWMGSFRNNDGKRESPGMVWLGVVGVVGIIFLLGNMT